MSNGDSNDFVSGVAWICAIAGAFVGLAGAENDPSTTAAAGFFGGAIVGGIGGAVLGVALNVALRLLVIGLGVLLLVGRFAGIAGMFS